jgi:AraC-like DNA-binding protein
VNLTYRQKFAGSAAALALLAGAGGALAAGSGGSGDRQTFLNDVAKRLKVSPGELRAAFSGALGDKLAADVKAGRITQAQADRIKKEAQEHGGLPLLPPPGPGGPGRPGGPPGPGGPPPFGGPPHGPPHGGPHGPIGAGLAAAAKYLGLTDAELRTRLEAGKSLADVAGEQKKSVDGLKSAIEAAVGKELHNRLDDIVNGKPGDRPPPGRARRQRGHHW